MVYRHPPGGDRTRSGTIKFIMKLFRIVFCIIFAVVSMAAGNPARACEQTGMTSPMPMACCCCEPSSDECAISEGTCCSVSIPDSVQVIPTIASCPTALDSATSLIATGTSELVFGCDPSYSRAQRKPLHLASNKVYLIGRRLLI